MRATDTDLVAEAVQGNRQAFGRVVSAYQRGLLALALGSTRNYDDALDATQDILLKAFLGLRNLRDPGRFPAWFWALARNELRSRARSRPRKTFEGEADPDALPAPEDREAPRLEGRKTPGPVSRVGPSPDQNLALALRYGAGLSVRNVALALGVPESVARSRIHEGLERLRRVARLAEAEVVGMVAAISTPKGLMESVMEHADTLNAAAAAVERLALCDQVAMVLEALDGTPFSEPVLAAFARVQGGPHLTAALGARLSPGELADILACMDPYSQTRIKAELERLRPGAYGKLTRRLWFYDGLEEMSVSDLGLVLGEAGLDAVHLALKGSSPQLRDRVMAALGEEKAAELDKRLRSSPAAPFADVDRAQKDIEAAARRLADQGSIAKSPR
ncbi:MAG TPA: FliG C-terminal domain-containing protein [Spirochaetales bacterium]|nr:FliG C-terminal domain-containing protein [Spirochaetales bacterium]